MLNHRASSRADGPVAVSRRARFLQFLSILLVSLGLVIGLAPVPARAADDITVHLSFEGFNLGQGYYVAPTALELPAGQSAAQASVAVLEAAGHAVEAGGAPDSAGFYLQGVAGFDTGDVAVPDYLTRQPGFELTGTNGDEYLGVGDYNPMAGWMLTVNNVGAATGAGEIALQDGDVVRWQFTLFGYGCDLGVASTCWGGDPYFAMADRSALIRALSTADAATATQAEKTAALAVGIDPTATPAQVAAAVTALTTASNYALTAPSDATVTVLHQPVNYASKVIAPAASQENPDGTTTHLYQVPATDGSYAYRASAAGELTQAGYITALTPVTISFPADGDPSSTTSSGFAQSANDDAGLLLNVGATGHLRLEPGEEFGLRAYRAPWQIVNSVVANKMIEPDYHYTVLSGDDVVKVTPDAARPGRATVEARGTGTAVVEVSFDAIGVGTARYGATRPDRTAVFVVTVGADQDASMSIDVTKPGGGAWDSEFDTWYLTGAQTAGVVTITGTPQAVTAWNPAVEGTQTLSASGGVYRPTLRPGTTIVKATSGDAVAFRTIRAARVTPQVTNLTDPGTDPAPGDQVKVHLEGAMLPVPKMAALYNPHFTGAKASYTDGASSYTGTSGQYSFSSANTLTVTIPATATDGFTLTGGHIKATHFGSASGAHRAIPADGLPTNTTALEVSGSYSVLPDLALIAPQQPAEPLDTAALEAALVKADGLEPSGHTAATWSALSAAVTDARGVLADPAATQAELDAAAAAITQAIAGLAMKGTAPGVPTVSATTTKAQRAAAGWLARELDRNGDVLASSGRTDWGITADAVFALAGAKVAGAQLAETAARLYRSGEDYVGEPAQVASRWPYLAKTVLALQVAGLDPTRFPAGEGTRDLVAELRGAVGSDGRFVTATDAFKTSLAVLALARTPQGVPARAVTAFESAACAEPGHANLGSFGYVAGCGSADIDTTALAVQALLAAGVDVEDPVVARAVAWLADQQASDGSFPSPWGPGNTNSAGLVGQSLWAVGEDATATKAGEFIASLQIGCTTAATEKITDPKVAATITAALGAVAYNAEGWDDAMEYGLDAANVDQWRRATAQAVLGLGAPTLGFVTAAGAEPAAPKVTCAPDPLTIPASAVKAKVTPPIAGDTITPGTVLGSGSVAAGYTAGYQWLRDGSANARATGRNYQVTAADQGRKLSVRVKVTRAGHNPLTVTSAAVGIPARTIALTAKYSGTVKVGKTLKAGGAPKGVKVSYQWLRGSKVVGKKSSYRVAAGDAGRTIGLRMTATRSGWTKTIKTTAAKAVPKVTPKVKATLAKSRIKPSGKAVVKVTVTAKGFKPGGSVRVSYGSKSVKATVKRGKVSVKLPKLKKGTYKLKVSYLGQTGLKSASARTLTLRVK